MLGRKERSQLELFISGSLRQLIPDDHMLVRVERVLDLSWLRSHCCSNFNAATAASFNPSRVSYSAAWYKGCVIAFEIWGR
jgi:hypothetical protein